MNNMNIDYEPLPSHLRAGMQRYIEEGVLPGSALRAILANDLQEAIALADEVTLAALPTIARWVFNEAPGRCHGSRATLTAWCDSFEERWTLTPVGLAALALGAEL